MSRSPRLLLLLLGISCVPGHLRTSSTPWRDGPFEVGPYLVHLGGSRLAVVVGDELAQAPVVEWRRAGETRATPQRIEAQLRDGLWVAELRDLPLGGRVTYRVSSRKGVTRAETFRAGRPRDAKTFRFAVFGDTRTRHLVHFEVIKALAREEVDFVIHTGDMVSYGVQLEEWQRFFAIERRLIAKRPLMPVMGNHDISTRGYFRRFFLADLAYEGNRYFARDWGNVRVVAMDDEVEFREGSDQHRFVDGKLAEGARRGMYLVMAMHEPPFSSGKHGSNLQMRRVVVPLAERHGVELVVSGHDHNYERTKPKNGVTFVVSGSGGAPIRPVDPQNFTATWRLEPHYVLVDVEERGLILRAVNLDGHTFDSYVIQPNPPRGGGER
jgi:3',5'-cyclic AMP phosphodiesterase CpdA